jgi:hypothetical protein
MPKAKLREKILKIIIIKKEGGGSCRPEYCARSACLAAY